MPALSPHLPAIFPRLCACGEREIRPVCLYAHLPNRDGRRPRVPLRSSLQPRVPPSNATRSGGNPARSGDSRVRRESNNPPNSVAALDLCTRRQTAPIRGINYKPRSRAVNTFFSARAEIERFISPSRKSQLEDIPVPLSSSFRRIPPKYPRNSPRWALGQCIIIMLRTPAPTPREPRVVRHVSRIVTIERTTTYRVQRCEIASSCPLTQQRFTCAPAAWAMRFRSSGFDSGASSISPAMQSTGWKFCRT